MLENMNKSPGISEYPYVFSYGIFYDSGYLRGKHLTQDQLKVMNPVMCFFVPVSRSKVFRFEMNQLKFRPDPKARSGHFAGHSYRIGRGRKSIFFDAILDFFYLYDGPKSLVFPQMSDPDFRDRLFMEMAVAGVAANP